MNPKLLTDEELMVLYDSVITEIEVEQKRPFLINPKTKLFMDTLLRLYGTLGNEYSVRKIDNSLFYN